MKQLKPILVYTTKAFNRKLQKKMLIKNTKKANELLFLMADASGFCRAGRTAKAILTFFSTVGLPVKCFINQNNLADLNSSWQQGRRKQKLRRHCFSIQLIFRASTMWPY